MRIVNKCKDVFQNKYKYLVKTTHKYPLDVKYGVSGTILTSGNTILTIEMLTSFSTSVARFVIFVLRLVQIKTADRQFRIPPIRY